MHPRNQYGLLNIVRREERSNRRVNFSSCFTARSVLSELYCPRNSDESSSKVRRYQIADSVEGFLVATHPTNTTNTDD